MMCDKGKKSVFALIQWSVETPGQILAVFPIALIQWSVETPGWILAVCALDRDKRYPEYKDAIASTKLINTIGYVSGVVLVAAGAITLITVITVTVSENATLAFSPTQNGAQVRDPSDAYSSKRGGMVFTSSFALIVI